MKKLLLCLVAVLCFSCTNYEKKLIGKWKYYVFLGNTEYDGEYIEEFKEDGTHLFYSYEDDKRPHKHKWSLEERNDSLILHIITERIKGLDEYDIEDKYIYFHGDTLFIEQILEDFPNKEYASKLYKVE